MKTALIVGDFHSGHVVGLTPPEWHGSNASNSVSKKNKWVNIRRELWLSFIDILKNLPSKPDVVIVNGDMIDGKGTKSGGTELITSDMMEQCDIAVEIIETIRKYCKKNVKIIGTYGTDYHVSTEGDEWENVIATRAGFDKIGSHEWVDIEGLVFDVKHHIGSSGIPHGRYAAVGRDMLWNLLWSEMSMQPRADIIIRSHVHYYTRAENSRQCGITLPALQGAGSKFGSKRCSGTVDWGCVLFQIKNKNDWDCKPYIRCIESQKPKVMKL